VSTAHYCSPGCLAGVWVWALRPPPDTWYWYWYPVLLGSLQLQHQHQHPQAGDGGERGRGGGGAATKSAPAGTALGLKGLNFEHAPPNLAGTAPPARPPQPSPVCARAGCGGRRACGHARRAHPTHQAVTTVLKSAIPDGPRAPDFESAREQGLGFS
jgi:hypothetical protein